MKKLISHAWFAGGVREFDTTTGSVSEIKDVQWGTTSFGSLWVQNDKWFALYSDDESILLQQGKDKFRLTSNSSCSISNYYVLRNFVIYDNEEKVYSIWYRPKGIGFSIIDPTYDHLDAESDDFFLYVKSMWDSWANKPYDSFCNEFDI